MCVSMEGCVGVGASSAVYDASIEWKSPELSVLVFSVSVSDGQ